MVSVACDLDQRYFGCKSAACRSDHRSHALCMVNALHVEFCAGLHCMMLRMEHEVQSSNCRKCECTTLIYNLTYRLSAIALWVCPVSCQAAQPSVSACSAVRARMATLMAQRAATVHAPSKSAVVCCPTSTSFAPFS